MVGLDEIKKSLDSNPYLTSDIKDCFMELIELLKDKFPSVDLSNLNERLKTVKVIKGSKFLIKNSSIYDPISNEMLFNLVKINDNIDCKHIIMRELLNLMTAKDNYTGFNVNNKYEALNIGYTEILANILVGNEANNEYEDEITTTSMLSEIIGSDNMFKAYFNNDESLIINAVM